MHKNYLFNQTNLTNRSTDNIKIKNSPFFKDTERLEMKVQDPYKLVLDSSKPVFIEETTQPTNYAFEQQIPTEGIDYTLGVALIATYAIHQLKK